MYSAQSPDSASLTNLDLFASNLAAQQGNGANAAGSSDSGAFLHDLDNEEISAFLDSLSPRSPGTTVVTNNTSSSSELSNAYFQSTMPSTPYMTAYAPYDPPTNRPSAAPISLRAAERRASTTSTTSSAKGMQQCVCEQCGKVFNSVWYLKQHAVKHSNDRPFRCKFCGKTYKFRSNLYQHKCPDRQRAQGPRANRRRRNKEEKEITSTTNSAGVAHQDSPASCSSGGGANISPNNAYYAAYPPPPPYTPHMTPLMASTPVVAYTGLYKCVQCPASFADEHHLHMHARGAHEQLTNCQFCRSPFGNANELQRHYALSACGQHYRQQQTYSTRREETDEESSGKEEEGGDVHTTTGDGDTIDTPVMTPLLGRQSGGSSGSPSSPSSNMLGGVNGDTVTSSDGDMTPTQLTTLLPLVVTAVVPSVVHQDELSSEGGYNSSSPALEGGGGGQLLLRASHPISRRAIVHAKTAMLEDGAMVTIPPSPPPSVASSAAPEQPSEQPLKPPYKCNDAISCIICEKTFPKR